MNHDYPSLDPLRHAGRDELVKALYKAECRNCGMGWDELLAVTGLGEVGDHPCTGNAYICRVARKLYAADPSEKFDEPWDLEPDGFRILVIHIANKRLPAGPWGNGVEGLLDRLKSDPTVSPVLADAMEEAGCTDAALLNALRTP